MIPALLLLVTASLAGVSFYSTGNDNLTDAGSPEDYYFTLSNDYGTNVTWFNITLPTGFVVDEGKSDPADQKNGSTYSYNVSLQPGDSVTKKIRAQAPSPSNDSYYQIIAACDQETVSLGVSVLAPLLRVTWYSAPGRVLANQVFSVNFTVENVRDSSHSGALYSVGSLTSPNTDYQVISGADIPLLASGGEQNASIVMQAPDHALTQNLTHTVYSRIAPFTYRDEFSTLIKTVYPRVNISVYNDSSYSVPAQEFLPNQTVYIRVTVEDPDDGTLIPGNLSIRIFDNDSATVLSLENFTQEQRIAYTLNSTAVSGNWTVTAEELTSRASARAQFKVRAVLSGLSIRTCRSSPCNQDTSHFAPADTLYAVITPVDQAGRPVTEDYNTSVTVTVDWNNSLAGQDQGTGELSVPLPDDYCTLTVNASAWNQQSNVSGAKHVDIPLFYSITLSPSQPYNYGQAVTVNTSFTDAGGSPDSPDFFLARVSDDSGEYTNSTSPNFWFTVSGTVDRNEAQALEVYYSKSHYNASFSTSLSVTNQLQVRENLLSEYHTGETANFSFEIAHANGQPATANVTVLLVQPNSSARILWQGTAHEQLLQEYFGQDTQTGTWKVVYNVSDAHGNNASLEKTFQFLVGVTAVMSAPGKVMEGSWFTVSVQANNSLPYPVNVSATLNNADKQTSLITSNGSHTFSWTTVLSSSGVLTVRLEWNGGHLLLSKSITVRPSGGSSGYVWYWTQEPKEEEEAQAKEAAGEEEEPEPAPEITMRLYTPEEGGRYYNPVTVGVVSNAEECVLQEYNRTLSGGAFGNYYTRLNFTPGINRIRVSCYKGNLSVTAERTFFVLSRPGEQEPAVQNTAEDNGTLSGGTRVTGHALLGGSTALGLAAAAGFFALAVGLRVIGPRVRRRYPIEGPAGWKRFFRP